MEPSFNPLTEIQKWYDEGIINENQRQVLLNKYSDTVDLETRKRPMPVPLTILSVFGVILIGLGVILFFASNWDIISKSARLIIIFISIIGAYTAGYSGMGKLRRYPRCGSALLLLGCFFYGSGIWLISQMYNVRAHYPNGVLFWIIGILPLIWYVKHLPGTLLAILLTHIWIIIEYQHFFYFRTGYIILVFILLLQCLRIRSRAGLFCLLGGIAVWEIQLCAHRYISSADFMIPFLLGFTGALYLTVSERIHKKNEWASDILRFYGLLLFFSGFFVFSVGDFYENIKNIYDYFSSYRGLCIFVLLISLTSSIITVLMFFKKTFFRIWHILCVSLILMMLLCSPMFPDNILLHNTLTIINNIMLLTWIIALISAAGNEHRKIYINLGILFFLIFVIAKYFDLFWTLRQRSLAFIGGGLLFFIASFFLEKRRRKLIEKINYDSE